MPTIGADFLRHFELLVDLGEMWLLACGGGWSQHLVEPSGSGTFATRGVIADQHPREEEEARGANYTFTSYSGGTWQQFSSSALVG